MTQQGGNSPVSGDRISGSIKSSSVLNLGGERRDTDSRHPENPVGQAGGKALERCWPCGAKGEEKPHKQKDPLSHQHLSPEVLQFPAKFSCLCQQGICRFASPGSSVP